MNLTDYLRVIRKRARIIILTFILVVTSVIYYTYKQTPIYSTSCKVKIEQRKSVAEILTELVTWSPGNTIASQSSLITSYQVVEKAAESLNLINPFMKDDERISIIKRLQNNISTEQVSYTNIIAITAVSSTPEYATNLVNTIAHVYSDIHFENKKKEAANARKFIASQMDSYLLELQKSENVLQEFRQANPLIVERDIKSPTPIQTNERVAFLGREIVKLELELISLKSKYTDEHPDVITLRKKLEKARSDLDDAITQFAAEQKDISSKEIQLVQLKRNVIVAEDLYLMFRKKHEEARILEAEKARDVTIIENASVPSTPISPNIRSNVIVGILSGFLIGLIMAFVTESLDTSVGRIDDIEELLKVPVLGIIPSTSLEKGKRGFMNKFIKSKKTIAGEPLSKRLVALFDPSSAATEAYRSLRTNIELIGLKKYGNSVVFTSSAPQEGKTQTLCNLAITMSQAGQKVLIIGSDFRKPMIYKLFGLNRSPGLSDVMLGNISWKKAINTTTDILLGGLEYEKILKARGIENLHILTCGEHTPNPAEFLNFPEMDTLIQELKQNFDTVFFDSPPTLPVTDSAILGTKVDSTIIVYQAGKTSRHAVLRCKSQLENVNVRVLGIVINNLKARFIEDVTPSQRFRYYGYYGEKRKKKSRRHLTRFE